MASFVKQDDSDRLARKFKMHNWEFSLLWGLLNLALAIMFLLDICTGSTSQFLISISPLFWYIEVGLILILFMNFCYDLGVYCWIRWTPPLQVTKRQQSLLGIVPSRDRGFVDQPDQSQATTSTTSPKILTQIPANNFFVSSSPRPSPSSNVSGLWCSSTHSPFNSSDTSMMSTTTSSWDYFDGDKAYKQPSYISSTPMKIEEVIADDVSLKRFLRSERGAGDELLDVSKDVSFNSTSSPGKWAQVSTQQTLSPIKARYQLSTRSPKSNSSSSESDLSKSQNGVLVWSNFGITVDRLVGWNENLRKWISKTIISRLVTEISTVNDLLRWQGTPDLQIGEVSLNALKFRAKGQHIPSLTTLLHYLDVTANQEYLVQRLKDLEHGGCLSEFRWNAGGDYKGKPWAEHLPTDSAIVMHTFFTYLDTHSPLSYTFPEGKAVTLKHFVQIPEKLNTTSKDSLYIYQSSVNPPHYQLVVGETVYELQKGRNNMFSALLLFLYHIKVKEDGMLRRINLGQSGLNLLWVMND